MNEEYFVFHRIGNSCGFFPAFKCIQDQYLTEDCFALHSVISILLKYLLIVTKKQS